MLMKMIKNECNKRNRLFKILIEIEVMNSTQDLEEDQLSRDS